MVSLITFRDELRARLRETWPAGIPVLTEAVDMIGAYLTAERDMGRIAVEAGVEMLAPTLIGAAHLLYADRTGSPPQTDVVPRMVTTVLTGVLREG